MARDLEDQLSTQDIKQKAARSIAAFCYLPTLRLSFFV